MLTKKEMATIVLILNPSVTFQNMHAVELIDSSTLLTMIIGAILFVIIFTAIFRKKR